MCRGHLPVDCCSKPWVLLKPSGSQPDLTWLPEVLDGRMETASLGFIMSLESGACPQGWRGLCRAAPHVQPRGGGAAVQVERCQQPMPGETREPGWERDMTGSCHPLCVSWHFDSALPRGVFHPSSCH